MNIKKTLLLSIVLVLSQASFAQAQVDAVLAEVERNNTELAAYRQQTDALKLENKTGIYLENPELEGSYQWGNPTTMGTKQTLSVVQSFDFPTVYGHRSKIASMRNTQSDIAYSAKRMEVLLQAKQICVNLVYVNKLMAEQQLRLEHAEQIAKAYNTAFDKGEANILDKNKANLNLLNAQKDVDISAAERSRLLMQLQTLNGGNAISYTDIDYPVQAIPASFDEWYAGVEAKNPELLLAQSEQQIAERQVGLSKSMVLPKLGVGYALENLANERFQGIVLGISIPLWEHKNTVKQAKAQKLAAESALLSVKQTAKGNLKGLYDKALAIQKAVGDYKQALQNLNSTSLLKKALDMGQIGLIEYYLELQLYYETVDKMLEQEQQLHLALAELRAWE